MKGADEIDTFRAAGFSDPEIAEFVTNTRQLLLNGGFSQKEVDEYFGRTEPDESSLVKFAKDAFDKAMDSFAGEDDEKGARPSFSELVSRGWVMGFQGSSGGLMTRGKLPDELLPEDAPFAQRLASTAGGLAGDIPVMIGGAIFGGMAGTAVAPGPGTIAGAGAGAFGVPALIREGLIQHYKSGASTSVKEFLTRQADIFLAGAKGAVTGAMTTTAGSLATTPLRALAAEVTTMTVVGKGLEGELPSPGDFAEATILVYGLRGATTVAGKGVTELQKQTVKATDALHNVYAKTGKRPQDIVEDIKGEPTIKEDMLSATSKNGREVPRAYETLLPEPPKPPVTKPPESKPVVHKDPEVAAAFDRVTGKIKHEAKDKAPDLNTREALYTETNDRLFPLGKLVKELADGEKIPADRDPYKGARFFPAVTARAQLFLDFEVRQFGTTKVLGPGLKQVLEPVRNDLKNFEAYAVARRTLELRERGIEAGAVKVADAKIITKAGKKLYEKPFRKLVEFQNNVARGLVDSGVITKEMFNKMTEANKQFVPFHREFSPEKSGGGGGSIRNPFKRIKGSERDFISPLQSIIKNTYLYTQLAERNSVGVKLVELAEARGETTVGGLMEKIPTTTKPIKVSREELSTFATQVKETFGIEFTPEELTIFRPQTFEPTKSQIAVFRKGKREVFEVGETVARSISKGLDSESVNVFVKLASLPARTLRAGTVILPAFALKNVTRDTFAATVQVKGFIPIWHNLVGLGMLLSKNTKYRDWINSGGANATIASMDRQYLQESLRSLTESTGLGRRAINVVKDPLQGFRILGELAENSTRAGAFAATTKGRRDPTSLAEGGFASREGTVDFSRKGASMKAMSSLVAFLNPKIQGYDRIIRAFKDDPKRAAMAATAAITVPSILLWAANKGDPRYDDLPDWQKNLFWIVLTDDHIIRIPKPHEPGVLFGSIPERLLDAFYDAHPDVLEDLRRALGANLVSSVMPNFAIPILESQTNHSFFRDAPLIPQRLESEVTAYQYTEYTTELAKAIGQVTGSKTSPDDGLSPIEIENYVRQWTGGLGVYAFELTDKLLREGNIIPDPPKPEDTLSDLPFIKSFVIRYPSSGAAPLQRFYQKTRNISAVLQSQSTLEEAGQFEKADELSRLNPGALTSLEGMRRTVSEHASLIRLWTTDETIPPDEKRQLIDETYFAMIEIAKDGLDILRDFEEDEPIED